MPRPSFKFDNQYEWDASTLAHFGKKYAPAAVRMMDGLTLMSYAGSVPPDWNGETVEIFDMFETNRLKYFHPDLYAEWSAET